MTARDPSYRQALSSLLWQPYECRPCAAPGQSRGDLRAMESQALVPPPAPAPSPRTFASAEAQTDDVGAARQHRRQRRRRRAQAVPDLLRQHLPPPYCAAPEPVLVAGPPPRSQRSPRGHHYSPEEEPKSCCGVVVSQTVSIRWFIVMIAFVGICCAVVGTVLGAMRTSGREHLTVSLLMIGVGIVLITVSGVAWRLTAHDAPSCRSMLGLGSSSEADAEPNRRFVPRLPPSYGRPHHPYAAMMYPEFQYRLPPPSYQASMQEYRLRLLLLDRHPGGHTVSPPPTYRSQVGGMLRAPLALRRGEAPQDSRPPSYCSRASTRAEPRAATQHDRVPEPRADNFKLAPADDSLSVSLSKGSKPRRHVVTIVHTSAESSPVIVTVSGSSSCAPQPLDGEMEILAHL